MPTRNYNRPHAWFAAALALAAVGCLEPPEYPDEPEIEFVGLTRDTMDQGALLQDSTTIVISFTDGDGDITFPRDDSTASIFVTNIETGEEIATFNVDPIDEIGVENGISGEFQLRVYTTCCDYPDFVNAFPCEPTNEYPVDTLLLETYIVDRAGNESNRAQIAPIYLRCDNF